MLTSRFNILWWLVFQVLIHSVLLRQITWGHPTMEMWFRLNGVDVRFGPSEFAMMMGLRFGEDTDYVHYVDHSVPNRIKETYFPGIKMVTYGRLFDVFETAPWGDDDSDAVKLALIYYVHRGLLGGDLRNNIPDDIFRLVEDLPTFDRFPWGSLVWSHTVPAMRRCVHDAFERAVRDHRAGRSTWSQQGYSLAGCPIAFQVSWCIPFTPRLIRVKFLLLNKYFRI